jgi:SpoVK/Ycf46/Vps4 family AAA+-type ATPase
MSNNIRKKLIEHLMNDIYCRIGVSKVAGVGVIAIKDIPNGIDPFKNLSSRKEKIIILNKNDLQGIDKNVKKVLRDFFDSNNSNEFHILSEGPNFINISYYLNHSNNPNIDIVEDNKSDYFGFRTNRIIKKGEELFINYNHYN